MAHHTDEGALSSPGLGTARLEGEECARTVRAALEAGYRHVDTAEMYDNERAVGEGVAAASVDRESVFLATKVSPGNLAPADLQESARASAERLGVDRLDLLYVHWPTGSYVAEETLPALDELVDRGLVRHVGLSNFTPALVAEARDVLDAPVFAHQVECHPLLPQRTLRADAAAHDTHLVGYSPLARGAALDHPVVRGVADDLGVSPARVALAWAMAHDVVPIPRARGDHLHENLRARSLDLPEPALERLDDIAERERVVDPDGAPWR